MTNKTKHTNTNKNVIASAAKQSVSQITDSDVAISPKETGTNNPSLRAERSKAKQSAAQIPQLRFKEFEGELNKVELKDTAEINPRSIELPETFIYIDLESVNNGVLSKEDRILKVEAPSRAQRLLFKNDILYQTVRPYQKNNYFFDKLEDDYVASTGYAQIRAKESSTYLYQYLHTEYFVNKVLLRCTGTSYPAINSSDLAKIKLNIPKLPEQQKIASFLTSVDTKIQQLTTKKELLTQYKKGAMQQLFSQQLRFKNENGKAFPDWEEKRLGEVVVKGRKIRYGIVQPGKYDPDGRFMIRGQDYSSVKGWASSSEFFRVSEIVENKYRKARVKSGDLLITIVGAGTGWLEVVPDFLEGANITQTTGRIAINKSIAIPGYVKNYFFSYGGRKEINRYIKGQAQPGLNIGDVEIFKLPLPCLEEQQKIANYLSAIDTKIETVNQQLLKTQTFKKGLLQQLFI